MLVMLIFKLSDFLEKLNYYQMFHWNLNNLFKDTWQCVLMRFWAEILRTNNELLLHIWYGKFIFTEGLDLVL